MPPCGMLLVVCLPVKSIHNRSFGDKIVVAVHTLGAILMIGGYCSAELHCLLSRGKRILLKPGEWTVRMIIVVLCLLCGFAFQVLGVLDVFARHWPCADVWLVPTAEHIQELASNPTMELLRIHAVEAMRTGKELLIDTAHGTCMEIKRAEYACEALAGLLMSCSMLVIWWFCPERHLSLNGRCLPPLSEAALRQQGYEEHYVAVGVSVELVTTPEDTSSD